MPSVVSTPSVTHLVLVANAEALVAGLLALVAAADVEAEHPDAGRLRQRRPEVGGRRDAHQLLTAEVGAHAGRRDVDDRRFRGDRHRLLQCRELQLHVDAERLA